LEGLVTPNGLSTSGWFRYDTTHPGTCNNTFGSTTGGISVGAGQDELPLTRAISGLLPGTTYYYCALAGHTLGITYGEVLSFTTDPGAPQLAPPPAPTGRANGVAVGATLAAPGGNQRLGPLRHDAPRHLQRQLRRPRAGIGWPRPRLGQHLGLLHRGARQP